MKSLVMAMMTGVACLTFAGGAVRADDGHAHMTVDTVTGSPGDPVLIRVGYMPAEAAFAIDGDGYVTRDGEIAMFSLHDLLTQGGMFQGWAVHDPLVLTSDFYFATGRLDGGDFRFEIKKIEAVNGEPALASWGLVPVSTFQPVAESWGATREARSFPVGTGGHQHGQLLAIEKKGVYDLTLVAWDANGMYTDSAEVKVRVTTFPAFCPADLNEDGVVDFGDYLEFLNLYDVQDPAVDFNEDGVVDFGDYLEFLNLYEEGC